MIKKLIRILLLTLPFAVYAAGENTKITSSSPKSPPQAEEILDNSEVKSEAPLSKPGGEICSPESDLYKTQFIKTVAAVLIVCVLVVLAILLFRRFSATRPLQINNRKHIKVIERRPLSPNTYLYYVQVGNKQFVIAESKLDVRTVANLEWTETEIDS